MDEELERFKREVNLVEFAAARGYEIDRRKSSRASVVMRHPANDDKIVISRAGADQHWTYFSVSDGRDNGTVVDFLLHREVTSIADVRAELRHWIGGISPRDRPDTLSRNVIAHPKDRGAVTAAFLRGALVDNHPYLNARGIRPETLLSSRFRGTFRRDHHGNVLFPHVDAAGLSGFEAKNHGWTRFSAGGTKGLWKSNASDTDTRLVLVESAIDAISYHQLSRDVDTRYASTAGTLSPHQRAVLAETIAGMPPGSQVALAFDADPAGERLADEVAGLARGARLLRHRPTDAKDWNECLQHRERDYIASVRRLGRSPSLTR
jgi:hypothetical protein